MTLIEQLQSWAVGNGVSMTGLRGLLDILNGFYAAPEPADPATLSGEARVQSIVRLEAPKFGYWLTRNNVGAFQDVRSVVCIHCHKPALGNHAAPARWTRFGLANESKQQNELVKSHDLIGFRRRVIVTADVGSTIAQFASREVKKEGWQFSPNDPHEQAQAAFRDFVNSNGGDAAFVSGPGSFQQPPRITICPPRKS